jgi:type IV fimbrial biogenesis protein FimT
MVRERGVSLIDMFVAISIAALLLSSGLPDFRHFLLKHNTAAETQQILRHLKKTRELAVFSGREMIFCGVNAENKCVGNNFQRFVIFYDQNGNRKVDADETVESELKIKYSGKVSLRVGTGSFFRFTHNGETRPSGSVFLCPANGDPKLFRRVSTNFTGRPYIARPGPDGIVVRADEDPIDCG